MKLDLGDHLSGRRQADEPTGKTDPPTDVNRIIPLPPSQVTARIWGDDGQEHLVESWTVQIRCKEEALSKPRPDLRKICLPTE